MPAVLACPSCASAEHDLVFTSRNGYPIRRCMGCRLVFTDDRAAPPSHALSPAVEEEIGTARSLFLKQRHDFVRRVTPTRGSGDDGKPRILDYGCGSGAFARFMAESGYEVVGLDPFSLGTPVVTDSLTLLHKPLESARAELGTFDVITLWHVLEHVHKPVELLCHLADHLADGGVFVISVPNFDSVQSRVFKGAWFHLDPPRHVVHFEPETLASTLARAGLREAEEQPFLPEYGTSGWVKSVLGRVLPRKSSLFELVLGAPVFAASLPIEAYAAGKNRAAALTVAARRT